MANLRNSERVLNSRPDPDRHEQRDRHAGQSENIYPKEVEDLLFRHPAVANKGYVPAALVVLKRGASAEAEALKTKRTFR
jgi:acyl-CoA synthetase (AMP-forming)/AMP-acid ligase II